MWSSHLLFDIFVFFPLQNLHTVSFPRPGYMELKPMTFDVGSEITLSFSTKKDNGTILFGRGGVTSMTQILTPVHIPRRSRRQTGEVCTLHTHFNGLTTFTSFYISSCSTKYKRHTHTRILSAAQTQWLAIYKSNADGMLSVGSVP